MRILFRWFALAIPIFPVLFLLRLPLAQLMGPPQHLEWKVDSKVPLVMVIFDEFPSISLLDEEG